MMRLPVSLRPRRRQAWIGDSPTGPGLKGALASSDVKILRSSLPRSRTSFLRSRRREISAIRLSSMNSSARIESLSF